MFGSAADSPEPGQATQLLHITEHHDMCILVLQVRFVNSGTEACLSVLRLMRAYTGREKLLKFSGCYHGHAGGSPVPSLSARESCLVVSA